MTILTRESLANAVQGHTDGAYVRAVLRLALAHCPVGDKYKSREFAATVEHLTMQSVRYNAIKTLKQALPGLRIPSDWSAVFDGVSIGASSFSRYETVVLTGCFASHPKTCVLYNRLLSAPSQGASKTGFATNETVKWSLQGSSQLSFSRRRLQASLVVIGGDGAVCRGGEGPLHANQTSPMAADLLYLDMFPHVAEPLTHWDLFHREERAGQRAVKAIPMALELL